MLNRRHLLGGAAALAASRPAFATATLRIEDRFSVAVSGTGQDVIFIPGLTCSRDVWDPVLGTLGRGYRVHMVEIAGFAGEAVRGNATGDVCAGVAEGLASYISKQLLTKPAIVGHSMGGTIGLMVAARAPAEVGKLMVVDMFPDMSAVVVGPNATRPAIVAAADGIGAGMAHADDAAYKKQLDANLDRMILTASARPAIEADGMRSDRGVAGRAMRELILTDLRPELPRITAPVTVVYAWNKAEPFTQQAADAFIRQAYAGLKHVRFVRIDNAAHFVFIDQPAAFDAALKAFLA